MVRYRMQEMEYTWVSRGQKNCGGADTQNDEENAVFIA